MMRPHEIQVCVLLAYTLARGFHRGLERKIMERYIFFLPAPVHFTPMRAVVAHVPNIPIPLFPRTLVDDGISDPVMTSP